jgi:hypothetical protein
MAELRTVINTKKAAGNRNNKHKNDGNHVLYYKLIDVLNKRGMQLVDKDVRLVKKKIERNMRESKKKAGEREGGEPKTYAQEDLQELFGPMGQMLSENVSDALNNFPSLEKQKNAVELFKDILGENPIGKDIGEINLFSKALLSLSNDKDKYALALYALKIMCSRSKDMRQVRLHIMSVALLPISEITEENEIIRGDPKEITKEKEIIREKALKAIRLNLWAIMHEEKKRKLVSTRELFRMSIKEEEEDN